ncbi:type VI secretion system-associated protein TagF [Pseudomonas wayambapalatensis]|nr:type VI secretion system-associated protein TagF [Pseudomonas wayambapalatensis]
MPAQYRHHFLVAFFPTLFTGLACALFVERNSWTAPPSLSSAAGVARVVDAFEAVSGPQPGFHRNHAKGLRASRERLGAEWEQAYRCSPIWHFALAAGVCGEVAWAGVMMPSVDRVGRYFPLTLAYGGPDIPVLERLRRDLSQLPAPSRPEPASIAPAWGQPAMGAMWLTLPEQDGMAQAVEQWLMQLDGLAGQRSFAGHALFWTEGGPQVAPTLLVSRGLPGAGWFVGMLGGEGGGAA